MIATPDELLQKQHTITALVQNETGTINRLVSLFRRRGFSIACFNAGDCEQPGFSRITLVVNGSEADLQQCLRQLDKLIDVVEVVDLKPTERVSRELALIRIRPEQKDLDKVYGTIGEFFARIPRGHDRHIVVEAVAETADIERLIIALSPFNITEIVRTGEVAMRVQALN